MLKIILISLGIIIQTFNCINADISQQLSEDKLYEHSIYDADYEETLVQNVSEEYGKKANIWDSDELSPEAISNRNGELIIERMLGKVIDEHGNGKILNPWNSDYDYINYSNVEGFEVGDEYVTYVIYNPETNEPDDRFDVKV